MDFVATFAGLAAAFPTVWIDAEVAWSGSPTMDNGGSIASPGTPQTIPCKVQFDACSERMRSDADFKEKDVMILVLRDGLQREIDTEAKIIVASGLNAGTWSIRSADHDPAGIGYVTRGRKW